MTLPGRIRTATRSSGRRRGGPLGLAFGLSAVLAVALAGCGLSPWEQDQSGASSAANAAPEVFVADSASIGEWRDERPSGLVIRHGMLIVDNPQLASGPTGGRSAIVITGGGAVYRKVADVLADRIPVTAGMQTNFALGETVSVKIERVEPDGRRATLAEGRVSFLELVRR